MPITCGLGRCDNMGRLPRMRPIRSVQSATAFARRWIRCCNYSRLRESAAINMRLRRQVNQSAVPSRSGGMTGMTTMAAVLNLPPNPTNDILGCQRHLRRMPMIWRRRGCFGRLYGSDRVIDYPAAADVTTIVTRRPHGCSGHAAEPPVGGTCSRAAGGCVNPRCLVTVTNLGVVWMQTGS